MFLIIILFCHRHLGWVFSIGQEGVWNGELGEVAQWWQNGSVSVLKGLGGFKFKLRNLPVNEKLPVRMDKCQSGEKER